MWVVSRLGSNLGLALALEGSSSTYASAEKWACSYPVCSLHASISCRKCDGCATFVRIDGERTTGHWLHERPERPFGDSQVLAIFSSAAAVIHMG